MSGIDGTQSVDNYTSRSVKAVLSVNSFQIATLQGFVLLLTVSSCGDVYVVDIPPGRRLATADR